MSTTRRSTSRGDRETGRQGDGGTEKRMIEVINRQRLFAVDRAVARRLSREVLDRIGEADKTLTLIFVRDRLIRQLNRDYRGVDKPTDVLSFAYREDAKAVGIEFDPGHLGDIVISVETAERYARELGLTFDREIEQLIIHGALHLAGYDHETDDGEMNRLEKKLRRELLK